MGLRPGFLFSVIVVTALHTLSFNRNFIFANNLTLYENAAKYAPHNPRAVYNLALAYANEGLSARSNELLSDLEKKHPLYLRPRVWRIKARNHCLMGDWEKGASYLMKSARVDPSPELIEELQYVLEAGRITDI